MLNWDDPLAAPAKPHAQAAKNTVQASTLTPVMLSKTVADPAQPQPAKIADIPRPAISPVVAKPINPEDKRIVNGIADINQLAPFKYPWA